MSTTKLRHPGLLTPKLAIGAEGLAAIERLILVGLAKFTNLEGWSFPSEQRLALETSLSVRGVRKGIRSLEARGLVKVVQQGRMLPNRYRIDVAALEALPRVQVTGTTGQSDRHQSPCDRHVVPVTGAECAAPGAGVTGTTGQSDRHVVPPNGSKNGSSNGGEAARADARPPDELRSSRTKSSRNGHGPSHEATLAWSEITAWLGTGRSIHPQWDDARIPAVVKRMGGWGRVESLRNPDAVKQRDHTEARREFCDLYDALAAKAAAGDVTR
jgi:hypothetical protein